mmetsp:Transcript_34369/g.79343  ORF Transcript_34369/g.79343 Transcript_34369/m.79343 type:complete len:89 (-) Transcript_34369:739-1005(-)
MVVCHGWIPVTIFFLSNHVSVMGLTVGRVSTSLFWDTHKKGETENGRMRRTTMMGTENAETHAMLRYLCTYKSRFAKKNVFRSLLLFS